MTHPHSSSFFRNTDCEYFPCHKVENDANFNCLFCYCPLYTTADCGGNFCYTDGGIKDCSDCTIPHQAENYGYILSRLKGSGE